MDQLVTKNEALRNRQLIAELWEDIPAELVDLDSWMVSEKMSDKQLLDWFKSKGCVNGNGLLKHNCGAVGCFAGWSWTHPAYQAWCEEHHFEKASPSTLAAWLGLPDTAAASDLFDGRSNYRIPEREEVDERIDAMLKMPVVVEAQEDSVPWEPAPEDTFETEWDDDE